MPVPLPPRPDLSSAVFGLLRSLPAGHATTYGRIARALGEPNAAKAVATLLLAPHPDADCRCHRAVRANGTPGLFAHGDAGEKLRRIAEDGVTVCDGRVTRFAHLTADDLFDPFRVWQREIAATAISDSSVIATAEGVVMAGVDVSYGRSSDGQEFAVAACVGVWGGPASGEDEVVGVGFGVERPAFPYVSGYLSVREVPAALAAIVDYRTRFGDPNVLLIDGNGSLHPRQAGVAVCIGVMSGLPAIGVAKSHLTGTVVAPDEDLSPIQIEGRNKGLRVRWQTPAMKKPLPLDVSPGHRIGFDEVRCLFASLPRETRLPRAIYEADRRSREEASRLTAVEASG